MSLPRLASVTARFFYLLADGEAHPKRDMESALVTEFRLSPTELEETTRSGRSKFGNLMDWAQADLVRAQLVEEIRPQVLALTDEGRSLARHTNWIPNAPTGARRSAICSASGLD